MLSSKASILTKIPSGRTNPIGCGMLYLDRWSDAAYMFAFNLSGLPAMSVPVAVTPDNVPIGMQIVGRHGDEATLLQLAQQMDESVKSDKRRPPVH